MLSATTRGNLVSLVSSSCCCSCCYCCYPCYPCYPKVLSATTRGNLVVWLPPNQEASHSSLRWKPTRLLRLLFLFLPFLFFFLVCCLALLPNQLRSFCKNFMLRSTVIGVELHRLSLKFYFGQVEVQRVQLQCNVDK